MRFFAANVGVHSFLYPLVTPPMGIMCLGAYARRRFGAEVCLVNQRLDNIADEEVARQAADFGADIVALSALTAMHKHQENICRLVRQKLPRALILLGGPHVSSFETAALEGTEADAAVPGEGELSLGTIIEAFKSGADFSGIPGIYWRDKDGAVVRNPGGTEIVHDLDSLPMPAYDLIDLPKYWKRQSMTPVQLRVYATLVSSRGCPYGCAWCHDIFGKRYRIHSAERIIDEMEFLQKQYGVSEFEFLDDIFNLDHRRLTEFCDRVQRRGKKTRLTFPNALRADILTAGEIDALVGAGMYFCSFALETGSPRLQKSMGKNLDIGKFLGAVEHAARRRVFTNGFVMLGFPTETREEMQLTLDVACKSRLHTASFFTAMPFPNTEMYQMALQSRPEKLANLEYLESGYSGTRINVSDEPDEVLWQYQNRAYRTFYRPRRLLRILRDYPQPLRLLRYIPTVVSRLFKH
jgi:radical SAM superfamily enzyme YgiQ (UPF0313 family)